jgi:molybdopterin converting factor small subunit
MTTDASYPTAPTTLRVKLFAGLAAAANTRLLELPWQGGTAGDLKAAVAAAVPAASALITNSTVAVADRYVAGDTSIPAMADVAMIPPVSGG